MLAALLGSPTAARGDDTEALLHDLEASVAREPSGFPDPLEGINRATFRFNQAVDAWMLEPVTRVYQFVMPEPVRFAVRRFIVNINSPGVLVNDLLQRRWGDAGTTTTRFAVNTTVGVAGFFDPAAAFGFDGHQTDFGHTLALAGVPSGPYLMLPVLGPTTVRDGFGDMVGLLFRPTTYLLGPGDQLYYSVIYGGSSGLVIREENAEAIHQLESGSVDYYAALRNAYYQVRTAEIAQRRDSQALTCWSTIPLELRLVAPHQSVDLLAGGKLRYFSVQGGHQRIEALALQ